MKKTEPIKPRIRWERIDEPPFKWQALNTVTFHSDWLNRDITVTTGDKSDGATQVPDIHSDGWGFHDQLCRSGKFDDGTKCSNLQASIVLFEVMWKEGHKLKAVLGLPGTFIGGGGECRKNGMFWVI